MIATDSLYKGFRIPEEIISHAVWLYYRFLLSLRDVQELLLERGVVSHTRRSGPGANGSDPTTPADCAAAGPAPATAGTSLKCS